MGVWFCLCVSLLFPSALWNHAQLRGGSDAERLMSTLAYGWVERCSDIDSCGPTSFQDNYSFVFYFRNYICFMNYYEQVEFLNDFFWFHRRWHYAYVYVFNSMRFYYHVHGDRFPILTARTP